MEQAINMSRSPAEDQLADFGKKQKVCFHCVLIIFIIEFYWEGFSVINMPRAHITIFQSPVAD